MLLRVSLLPFMGTLASLLWLAYLDDQTHHPAWFSQLSHAWLVLIPLLWGLSLWWGWRRAQQLTQALERLVAGQSSELPGEFAGLAHHLTSLQASLKEKEGSEASRQALLRRAEVQHRLLQRLTQDSLSKVDLDVWAQGLRTALEASFHPRTLALWVQDGREFVWTLGDQPPEQRRRGFGGEGTCWIETDSNGEHRFFVEIEAHYEAVLDLPKPIRLVLELTLEPGEPLEETRERLEGIAGMLSVSWANWTLYQELQSRIRISRNVIESLEDGVLLIDRRGNILGANRATGTILGTPPENLEGQPLDQWIQPETENSWSDVIARREVPGPLERAIRRPNQAPVDTLVLTYLTDSQLNTSGGLALTVVLRDVTKQRELENLRSDFTATLSHELRTPLTSMKGYLQTLMHRKARQFDMDKIQSIVSVVNGQADHLQRLIQELLEAAKMRTQDLEIHPRPIEIQGLLERSLAEATSNAKIQKKLVCTEVCRVECDPERIYSVLEHLLSNAEKYSLPGGTVELGCRPEEDRLAIWVRDEGVGIPLDQQEKIFEMYHRLDTGNRRTHYGVGIGLYLARKVVEGHGGEISVESSPGCGATFTFTLPLCSSESGDSASSGLTSGAATT